MGCDTHISLLSVSVGVSHFLQKLPPFCDFFLRCVQDNCGTDRDEHCCYVSCDNHGGDRPCPVDCDVSDWSDWDTCTVTCGGGIKTRDRTITVSPDGGGAPCPPLNEEKTCNKKLIEQIFNLIKMRQIFITKFKISMRI